MVNEPGSAHCQVVAQGWRGDPDLHHAVSDERASALPGNVFTHIRGPKLDCLLFVEFGAHVAFLDCESEDVADRLRFFSFHIDFEVGGGVLD